MKLFSVKIKGERWTIRTRKNIHVSNRERKFYGNKATCRGQCWYRNKTILLREDNSRSEMLIALIHETMHARFPEMSEWAVTDGACTIAEALDEISEIIPRTKGIL